MSGKGTALKGSGDRSSGLAVTHKKEDDARSKGSHTE